MRQNLSVQYPVANIENNVIQKPNEIKRDRIQLQTPPLFLLKFPSGKLQEWRMVSLQSYSDFHKAKLVLIKSNNFPAKIEFHSFKVSLSWLIFLMRNYFAKKVFANYEIPGDARFSRYSRYKLVEKQCPKIKMTFTMHILRKT